MIPKAEHPVALPGRVIADVFCAACDYNLRGLHSKERCPECGADIAPSLVDLPEPKAVARAVTWLSVPCWPICIPIGPVWTIGPILSVVFGLMASAVLRRCMVGQGPEVLRLLTSYRRVVVVQILFVTACLLALCMALTLKKYVEMFAPISLVSGVLVYLTYAIERITAARICEKLSRIINRPKLTDSFWWAIRSGTLAIISVTALLLTVFLSMTLDLPRMDNRLETAGLIGLFAVFVLSTVLAVVLMLTFAGKLAKAIRLLPGVGVDRLTAPDVMNMTGSRPASPDKPSVSGRSI